MVVENDIAIDAVDIEYDQLMVRGKNLAELVGRTNYTAALYHILTGKLPDNNIDAAINCFMVRCVAEALVMKNHYMQIQSAAALGCEIESLVMVALLLFEPLAKEKATQLLPDELAELDSAAEGIFLMALIPSVICYAIIHSSNEDATAFIQEMCGTHQNDFFALMLTLLTGKGIYSLKSLALLNALLISLHAGFGIITPTIVLSRFSASTRASMAKNIVAGFTGSGPSHVGACKAAMALFKKLKLVSDSCVESKVRDIFCCIKPIPGFGHPILNIDPRNEMLSSLIPSSGSEAEHFRLYQQVVSVVSQDYQLQPNVDLIAAAIMLDLGFDPSLGTILFLFARIPTMIAHAIEKQKAPPFGISKKEAREHFSVLPKRWI